MIKDFIKTGDVPEELIKEYEDKLPVEVIDIWKNVVLEHFTVIF